MSTSGFLITDAGLAAATAAAPGGPYIHITSFKVGSASGYVPSRAQTGLSGSTLYTGVPISYTIISTDLSQILCVMDASVGSFNFGEMGVYLQDGTLFAICVWDALQEKVKAVGAQAGNNWKIHCLLSLAQAPAIVQVTLVNSQGILEVPIWPLLAKPADQISGANIAIVHDNDQNGSPVTVVRNDDNTWAPIAYTLLFTGASTDSGASSTTTSFTHPNLASVSLDVPSTTSKYLARLPDGQIRKIYDKPSSTSISWTAAATAPAGTVTIWQSDSILETLTWSDAYEYNQLIALFNPYWSTPSGGYNGTNKGMNQTAFTPLTRKTVTSDWTALLAAMTNVSNILSVSTTKITGFTDYVYHSNNASFSGLQTVRANWDNTIAQIGLIDVNRNTFASAYQGLTPYADHTYSTYWNSDLYHVFAFTFADANTLQAQLNSGFALTLTPTVTSPTITSWTNLQTDFVNCGPLVINPNNNYSTAVGSIWAASGIGLHSLVSTLSPIAEWSAQLGWGCWITAKLVGNVITIQIQMRNAHTGTYSYATPGTIHFAWVERQESVLTSPALAIPTLTYTQSTTSV